MGGGVCGELFKNSYDVNYRPNPPEADGRTFALANVLADVGPMRKRSGSRPKHRDSVLAECRRSSVVERTLHKR